MKKFALLLLAFCTQPAQANADLLEYWHRISPWGEPAEPPPEQKPFELPRLYSDEQHYNSYIEPLRKTPSIDPDSVFTTVLKCFPAQSAFNAELSVVGGFRNGLDQFDQDLPTISSHYVGLVGKIPLYSADERARRREREYQIRTITAQNVAGFIAAIASRNQAYREVGLYRALEARAQARVLNGIAPTTEQVTFLEKVAASHAKVIQQEALIVQYRLALGGLCENSKREQVNTWLMKLTELE